MKTARQLQGALVLLLACSSAYSDAISPLALEAHEKPKSQGDDFLTGIVINRTVTVLGWDFYHYFAAAWRENEASDHYSVSVYERPTAIRGSEVWVEYNHQRVFHTYLSPARSAVKDVSEAAVKTTYENIAAIDINRLLFQDKDLGSEELL